MKRYKLIVANRLLLIDPYYFNRSLLIEPYLAYVEWFNYAKLHDCIHEFVWHSSPYLHIQILMHIHHFALFLSG